MSKPRHLGADRLDVGSVDGPVSPVTRQRLLARGGSGQLALECSDARAHPEGLESLLPAKLRGVTEPQTDIPRLAKEVALAREIEEVLWPIFDTTDLHLSL